MPDAGTQTPAPSNVPTEKLAGWDTAEGQAPGHQGKGSGGRR